MKPTRDGKRSHGARARQERAASPQRRAESPTGGAPEPFVTLAELRDCGVRAYFLVVDLEATTSPDGSLPKSEMEIIEIGAVLVNVQSLAVEDEFQSFVRPVRHPQLHPFCTQLTSIAQRDVASAATFPEVLDQLGRRMLWAHISDAWFCSWGDYDGKQWRQDCARHGLTYAMPPHENLKRRFSEVQGLRKKLGLAEALTVCGLEFSGTHHRGIDDARNTARLLPWIVGDERIRAVTK